jgi:hypothetical protein
MPGLFILTGLIVPPAVAWLRRAVEGLIPVEGPRAAGARAASAWVVGLVTLFAIVTTPAFNASRRIPVSHRPLGWTTARSIIDSVADQESGLVVGSSVPFEARHYVPRTEFAVGTFYLDSALVRTENVGGAPTSVRHDWYAGLPIFETPEKIRTAFPEADVVVVFVDDGNLFDGNVTPALVDVLTSEGEPLCRGRCLELEAYLWRLRPSLD